MNRQLLKDSFGWGFILWLIGYILGIVLFFVLPSSLIGWDIMPIGVVVTLWVLMRRVTVNLLQHFVMLAGAWTVIAVVLDYVFQPITRRESTNDGEYSAGHRVISGGSPSRRPIAGKSPARRGEGAAAGAATPGMGIWSKY